MATKIGTESRRTRTGQFAITETEWNDVLAKIPHLEDEALIRLAVATGMRREDIIRVELSGVNLDRGEVTFYESKKRRPWSAYIGPDTTKTLAQHIHTLPPESKWLFPSPRKPKDHISSRHAYDVWNEALHRAGISSRPFHAARSTCIKLLQKKGWSIEQVMRQTGDTFRVIKEHYDVPTEEEMKDAAQLKGI